jgi:hypothetical protein
MGQRLQAEVVNVTEVARRLRPRLAPLEQVEQVPHTQTPMAPVAAVVEAGTTAVEAEEKE